MIPIKIAKSNVLIVAGRNERVSSITGKYCSKLGANVTILGIDLHDNIVVIENLNAKGITYASVTRQVSNEYEARELLNKHLSNHTKFSLVINLAGNENFRFIRLIDMLDPRHGILCTPI